MTRDQEIALEMFLAIEKLCSKNYWLWKEHYGFRTAFHLFSGRFQQLRGQMKRLENLRPVNPENRERYHQLLEELTCTISEGLLLYALTHDRYELIDKLEFNREEIKAMPCDRLYAKASEVLELAIPYARELKAYDVGLIMLGELEMTLESLSMCMQSKDITQELMKEMRKKLEEGLDDLFHQTKVALRDHLDQQIVSYKWSHRDFYDLYMDLRGSKPVYAVPLQGSVVDDATHLPVGNADITIPELNVSRHITPMGHFIFYNLPPGRYHARVHKFGYEDRIIEVTVPDQHGGNLDIEMHHI